jgi:hypothetical protein
MISADFPEKFPFSQICMFVVCSIYHIIVSFYQLSVIQSKRICRIYLNSAFSTEATESQLLVLRLDQVLWSLARLQGRGALDHFFEGAPCIPPEAKIYHIRSHPYQKLPKNYSIRSVKVKGDVRNTFFPSVLVATLVSIVNVSKTSEESLLMKQVLNSQSNSI